MDGRGYICLSVSYSCILDSHAAIAAQNDVHITSLRGAVRTSRRAVITSPERHENVTRCSQNVIATSSQNVTRCSQNVTRSCQDVTRCSQNVTRSSQNVIATSSQNVTRCSQNVIATSSQNVTRSCQNVTRTSRGAARTSLRGAKRRGNLHSDGSGICMSIEALCLRHSHDCLSELLDSLLRYLLICYLSYKTVKIHSAHRTCPA